MVQALIDQFEAGGTQLDAFVRDLTPEQRTARPGPGNWSIHEIVIHLADSDAIGIDRMKRVISEDDPPLLYADETAYVQTLFPHDQAIDDAVVLLALGRRQFSRVLRKLPDAAFQRTGTHNVTGRATLVELLQANIDHVRHHLEFARKKLERLSQ